MLNRAMTTTDFDSGSLSAMATIAHRMSAPGTFSVEAADASGRVVKRCDVVVREGASPRAAINLLDQDDGGSCCEPGDIFIAPNGMLSFHAVAAKRGVVIRLTGRGARLPAWNSQALEPGDIFACMPLRPGRYGVYEEEGAQRPRMHLRVIYPDPRLTAQGHKLRSGSVHMRADLDIDSGQAVMFAIERKARIRVRLEEPDDGPPELAEWRAARDRQVLDDALKRWTRKGKASAY